MMPDDLCLLSLHKNEVKDCYFMLMSSVIIFSDAIRSVHLACLYTGGVYQLSIWRVEFLSVATHKQWKFSGYYLFYWSISNLSVFGCFLTMKRSVATLVMSKSSLSLCWTWVCLEL